MQASIAGEVEARVSQAMGEQFSRVEDHAQDRSEQALVAALRLQSSLDLLDARLREVIASVAELHRDVAELTDTVAVQVDVENQTTALLGRLLQSASARIELLEGSLGATLPASRGATADSDRAGSSLAAIPGAPLSAVPDKGAKGPPGSTGDERH